jgi:hypothetical protein
MTELIAILWLLAGVFAIWQIGIGIGAIAIIARGDRVTTFGVGPGILAVILAIVAILL